MQKFDKFEPYKDRLSRLYYWMLGVLGLLTIITAVVVRVYPTTYFIKLLIILTLLYAAFIAFIWLMFSLFERPKMLYLLLFLAIFGLTGWFMAKKEPSVSELRGVYVSRLKAHIGIKYALGGETTYGIDEVGLAKATLWQAMLIEGIRGLNPGLLGLNTQKFWLANFDAQDLLDGKNDCTVLIERSATLRDLDSYVLNEGDIAITLDQKNVMIYVGDGDWVSAMSDDGKVSMIQPDGLDSGREVCEKPVSIVRWSILYWKKGANDAQPPPEN